jgi:lysyl-tRNA synthetase class 2
MSSSLFDIKKAQYMEQANAHRLKDIYLKTHSSEQALELPEGQTDVAVAGRVVGLRPMGKIIFAHLFDFTGKIQICIRKQEDNSNFDSFLEQVSVGDFVGCVGEVFLTKTGEKTIRVASFELLNKCLRPLPEKYHGLEDVESRYRQRYLDVIMNPESRVVFQKRIQIVRHLRRFLEDDGYLEVETPVLQTQPSGALARPFFTKHNALGMECSLRIAPETYLKRCIGAGMDKVFEFARCFRNEGISAQHLQDFTMLEFYASYYNSTRMQEFVAKMISSLIHNVFGTAKVQLGTGENKHEIDFSGEWPNFDYCELLLKHAKIDIQKCNTKELLMQELESKQIWIEDAKSLSWANLVDALYKKTVRPHLIQPCFISRYPAEMAPLARRNAANPQFVDLFQFLVNGVEIVKAYSELVDPLDQRTRFEEQLAAKEAGDEETMPMDEDFLTAMEHGFPPISGVGIGIDRLTMVLCGCENIKDTVLFPLLRPQT